MDSIVAENVWVKFNVRFVKQQMSLRRFLVKMAQPRNWISNLTRSEKDPNTFWALRDISLHVKPGEIVGLLGPNGAGKSTMLMMLAGIYSPDRGHVHIRGKIGTLLSLGGGFNPDLTGRENIRQNAIFLGIPPAELEGKIDQIIQLADIGKFIDAPIRTYSSGMRARLGFSVAVHVNPDVMLLDEVMETGDAAFRQRSRNLLDVFREQGKTVVISSHNTNALKEFCTRIVLLEHGQITAEGPCEETIERYTSKYGQRKTKRKTSAKAAKKGTKTRKSHSPEITDRTISPETKRNNKKDRNT